jgi:hypothetical protein
LLLILSLAVRNWVILLGRAGSENKKRKQSAKSLTNNWQKTLVEARFSGLLGL